MGVDSSRNSKITTAHGASNFRETYANEDSMSDWGLGYDSPVMIKEEKILAETSTNQMELQHKTENTGKESLDQII